MVIGRMKTIKTNMIPVICLGLIALLAAGATQRGGIESWLSRLDPRTSSSPRGEVILPDGRNATICRISYGAEFDKALSKASDCERIGNYDEALRIYSTAIANGAPNDVIHFRRGELYKRLKMYNEAIGDFSAYIEEQPSDLQNRIQLAACYYELKQYERAMSVCKTVIAMTPNSAEAIYMRGKILFREGKYNDALQDLKQCCNPSHSIYLQPSDLAEATRMRTLAEKEIR